MTGIIPIVIPTFIKKWIKIKPAMEYAKFLMNGSLARSAIITNRKSITVNNMIKLRDPINPCSSPNVLNIKSVFCSGT